MRGQAFVVFRDTQMAKYAIKNLHNFSLFGKEIDVQFAKRPSEATLLNRGQYDSKKQIKKRDKKL